MTVGPLRVIETARIFIMKRSISVFWIVALLLVCACGPAGGSVEAAGASPSVFGVSEAGPSEPARTDAPTPTPFATPEPNSTDTPAPTHTPAPSDTPEPIATDTPQPSPAYTYTLAWFTDTQIMMSHYRKMLPAYNAMCRWVADHAEDHNIVAFLHTGDMVDTATSRGQWDNFSRGMEVIAEKMPLFVTLGNHDFYDSTVRYVWKEQFFFKNIPEERRFRDGQASYMELSVGSTDLLFIQLAFREKNNLTAIQWLRNVCNAHADRTVIFVVHAYLTNDGRLMEAAKIMERELVSQCPNIRLIVCGHSRGIARQDFPYDDDGDGVTDRTVHVLMHDLQLDRERYGYLNLLTFDPEANTLSVDSYAPFYDDYIYDDENPDAERFTIENVF